MRLIVFLALGALLLTACDSSSAKSPERSDAGRALQSTAFATAGAAFYVAPSGSDSNPGTLKRPWKTINRALARLRPGQTALVRAGTYAPARCERGMGGSPSGGYVTLKAFPGSKPVIAGAVDGVVRVACDYFRLEGFVIGGPAVVGGTLVYGVQNSDHVEITGNEIRESICQGAFLEEETDAWRIVGNWIHDNGHDCDQQAHGIYLQGDGHVVANNVIDNQPEGYGIQAYDYNRNVTIANNTIVHSGRGGIVIGGSGCRTSGVCGVSGAVVVNNILAFNTTYGIARDRTSPASCDIHSNLAFDNGEGSFAEGWPASCLGANRTADPRFANVAGRDYHVVGRSPAVDAGDAAVVVSPDFDGVIRLTDIPPDLGAYERLALPPPLPASKGKTFVVSPKGSDSNPGTRQRPWKTIQQAFDRLRPGQTALVRAGTYPQSLVVRSAGSASAPITVRGFAGEAPVIRPGGSSPTDFPLLVTEGAAYVRISGLVVEGAARPGVANVLVSGRARGSAGTPHDIELSQNRIRNGKGTGVLVGAGASNISVIGNLIHDNGPGRGNRGLDFQGLGLVANNVAYGQARGDGIHIRGVKAGETAGTVIVTNNTATGNGGTGIAVQDTGSNVAVVNNVSAFNRTYGIRGYGCCPRHATSSTAYNNVLYRNRRAAAVSGTAGVIDLWRGNMAADPRFVDRAAFDFRLASGSPAVDRGLAAYAPRIDRNGVLRPQGAAADVGAYEQRRGR